MSVGHDVVRWHASRARGVNMLSVDTLSINVSTFIACRVTIRLRAPRGMGVYVCGAGDPTGAFLGHMVEIHVGCR
jgi:hypothetical protein